jgi:hypothetical protein
MCAQVSAAVRELEPSYQGRVRLEVVEVTTQAVKDEVARYDVGSHGLVALDATGAVVGKIPGHAFGKDQIVAKADALLPR